MYRIITSVFESASVYKMKSSLEKFGRKLTMHKNDGKEKKDHQPSAHLDELVQVSKVGILFLFLFPFACCL